MPGISPCTIKVRNLSICKSDLAPALPRIKKACTRIKVCTDKCHWGMCEKVRERQARAAGKMPGRPVGGHKAQDLQPVLSLKAPLLLQGSKDVVPRSSLMFVCLFASVYCWLSPFGLGQLACGCSCAGQRWRRPCQGRSSRLCRAVTGPRALSALYLELF